MDVSPNVSLVSCNVHIFVNVSIGTQKPSSSSGCVIYALIIPLLAVFGIIANFINGVVFMRPRMTPSAFTYLAAMSWMDCISCLLMLLSTLAQSLFAKNREWSIYDRNVHIPLIGMTTGAANLILVSVSLDRLVYVTKMLGTGPPQFCSRKVAIRMIIGIAIITVLSNIPYFFIFNQIKADGTYATTNFFNSTYYAVYNWFSFILFGLFPAIFLMIANAIMLSVIRKWCKPKHIHTKGDVCYERKRLHYQIRLTTTLVAVIFLFFIGDLPAHLASRKSAFSLLFPPHSPGMEKFRLIAGLLNVIQLSFNIVIYSTLNPAFLPELFECLNSVIDRLIPQFYGNKNNPLAVCGRQPQFSSDVNSVLECNNNARISKEFYSNGNEFTYEIHSPTNLIIEIHQENIDEINIQPTPNKTQENVRSKSLCTSRRSCLDLSSIRKDDDQQRSTMRFQYQRRSLPTLSIKIYDIQFENNNNFSFLK